MCQAAATNVIDTECVVIGSGIGGAGSRMLSAHITEESGNGLHQQPSAQVNVPAVCPIFIVENARSTLNLTLRKCLIWVCTDELLILKPLPASYLCDMPAGSGCFSLQQYMHAEHCAAVIRHTGAGLCCAAMLAKYGLKVVVCEAHDAPGGAAHEFKVSNYSFDSGPSFFAGLSGQPHRLGWAGTQI